MARYAAVMETNTVRLDVWLWAARFFRSRALARQAVEAGRVELAGVRCKPARALRVGDRLTIRRGVEEFAIEVLALSDSRGSATIAQGLYREDDGSRARREEALAQRRAARAGFQPPPGRPDKRARRLIQALGDIDTI